MDSQLELLEKAVEIIKDTVQPKKIFLFGSTVSGKANDHSDFDLLIVIENHQHRRKTAQKIYENLVGFGHAVDLVVVTEADVLKHRENTNLIIHTALTEGRQLYAA
ncbi:MAG: nucleotidyltransferase domain-containing protein [Leptospiraceae bacterium]|nr:nucleotidyltransferase domain-containing protein [Leptospiraceae bacterium]